MSQVLGAVVLSVYRVCEQCGAEGTSRVYNMVDPWGLALSARHWRPIDQGELLAADAKYRLRDSLYPLTSLLNKCFPLKVHGQ